MKNCEYCGNEFSHIRSDKRFCNRYCKDKYRYVNANRKCSKCNNPISLFSKGLCIKCRDNSHLKDLDFSKENNGRWKGGISAPYYQRLGQSLGNKCRLCDEGVYKYHRHTHHIDGNNKNNILNNLVILCAKCHKNIHNKQFTVRANTLEELKSKFNEVKELVTEELKKLNGDSKVV